VPPERQDFCQPRSGEDQQPYGSDDEEALSLILLCVVQRSAKALQLLLSEIPLPLVFAALLYVPARHASIPTQSPTLCHVHHFRQYGQRTVRLIGVVAVLMMELRNVGAGEVSDPMPPKIWLDVVLHCTLIFLFGARLAVPRNVFAKKPLSKFRNRYG